MSWTSLDDETNLDFYYLLNTGDRIIPEHPYRKNSTTFQMNVPYLIGTTDDEGRGRIYFDWLPVTIDKLTIPEGGYSISYYHHPNFVSGLSWEEFIFLLAKSGLRMIDKQSQYELTL